MKDEKFLKLIKQYTDRKVICTCGNYVRFYYYNKDFSICKYCGRKIPKPAKLKFRDRLRYLKNEESKNGKTNIS